MALNSILNRTVETAREGLGQATKLGRGAAHHGVALGKRFANRNPQAKEGMDDVTLARKVESEIFRPKGAPKGKIDVNAVEGVVWLRGEVKNQAQIAKLETQVRAIPEVRGVENLLHLPKTAAPSRTRAGAKKTTAKKSASQGKRFERGQTSEKPKSKSTTKEPLPTEAAAADTGRATAPLGTQDPEAPAQTTSDSVTAGTTPTPATGGNGSGS